MNDQMIRVISSPSSSTTGFFTLIFAMCVGPWERGGPGAPMLSPARQRALRHLLDFGAWPPSRDPRTGMRRGRRTRSSTRCRRWRASTCSRATCRSWRPSSARAPAGCASAPSGSANRRRRAAAAVGPPGQREQAGAAHPRPLRPPHRRGRVPPRLAPADGDGRRARAALAAVDERASRSRTRRAPRCT